MFAENMAFIAFNFQDAQEIITCFLESMKAFGRKIKLKKDKFMNQPPLGTYDVDQDIQIEG